MKKAYLSARQINTSVRSLAHQIDRQHAAYYPNTPLVLVGMMQGALHFVSDLSRSVKTPHIVGYVFAASRIGKSCSGIVTFSHVSQNICGDRMPAKAHVILVDEICDTGITLAKTRELLKSTGCRCIETCTLLCRAGCEKTPEYMAKLVNDGEFFIGYGLDDNQALRHLPYITVL